MAAVSGHIHIFAAVQMKFLHTDDAMNHFEEATAFTACTTKMWLYIEAYNSCLPWQCKR